MRKVLTNVIFALVIFLIVACTKKSTTNKPTAVISTPSNTLVSAVSSNASDTSSILSSVFTSVCPSTLGFSLNNKKRLYYIVNDDVYEMSFPERTKKRIFSIPADRKPAEKDNGQIQIANGNAIWMSGQKLLIWDGMKIYTVRILENALSPVTSFLISPNGQCIVWSTNEIAGYPDEDEERFHESEYKVNIVHASRIGSQDLKEVFKQTYTVSNLGSDNRKDKQLLIWSKVNSSTLYMTTHFDQQLYSGHEGVNKIDFIAAKEENIDEFVEEFLAFSPDEKKIAYTPNDETCCSGSNYTNNIVTIRDVVAGKNTLIYDEWKEFGNKGKEDEYFPFTAVFSPYASLIAISITGTQQLVSIRKIDGTGKPLNLMDRFALGWLDEKMLLVGKQAKRNSTQQNKVEDIFIYDLKSGKEESLSLNNITFLVFE